MLQSNRGFVVYLLLLFLSCFLVHQASGAAKVLRRYFVSRFPSAF